MGAAGAAPSREETMTDRELLDFIQRILQTGSQRKAALTLSQLQEILSRLITPQSQLRLLKDAIDNLPEAGEIVRNAGERPLTARDLEIAAQRGKERRRREEEMRDQGRC